MESASVLPGIVLKLPSMLSSRSALSVTVDSQRLDVPNIEPIERKLCANGQTKEHWRLNMAE